MQFGPRFNQASLPGGQRSRDDFDWLNADDRHLILPIGMEIGDVVLPARLGVHADDDAEEAAEFGHI